MADLATTGDLLLGAAGNSGESDWRWTYRRKVIVTDAVILMVVVIGVQAATEAELLKTPALAQVPRIWRWGLAALLLVGWIMTTAVTGSSQFGV